MIEEIEKIFEKHTVAFTKTTQQDRDFNDVEVISFDTVVLNAYEAKQELLALQEKTREQTAREITDYLTEIVLKSNPHAANSIKLTDILGVIEAKYLSKNTKEEDEA